MFNLMGPKITRKAGMLFINAALISLFSSSQAADIANGKQLHDEHCTRCHQAQIYQRENRIVKNLQHLRTHVQFCEISNDLIWFDEELDDVTEYLNVNYYLFELK